MVGRVALGLGLMLAPAMASAQTGLLVVAHGAGREWNDRVRETVAQVRWAPGPVSVAFLMGEEMESAGWAAGVDSLVAGGAKEIVVVPLMVSSHGSHYRQIRFYAGELAELPGELAAHADHGPKGRPPVPMRVTAALDDAPELAAALGERWRALDARDRSRALLLVAHGPNDSAEAVTWVRNITAVSEGLRTATGKTVHVALLRDDAPPPVRARAIAMMRDSVLAMARAGGDSVVAMPVMISAGAITQTRIPRDLAELPIRYYPTPLTPLPAIARWIERSARSAGLAAERGGASADGRRHDLDVARARIKAGGDADRQRPLLVHMPDGKAVRDGDAERTEVRRQHLVEPHRAVGAAPLHLGEATDHDTGNAGQEAGQAEMREHAVDPVDLLADVLDEEDGAVERGKPRRPDERLDQREVSADEGTLRGAAGQGHDAVLLRDEHAFRLRQAAEPPGRRRPG